MEVGQLMGLVQQIGARLRPMFGASEPQPDRALDRWLLLRLYETGPWTAESFTRSQVAGAAGPKDRPGSPPLRRLTERQLEHWVQGAFDRGLLDTRVTQLTGSGYAPPRLTVTEAGSRRIVELHRRRGIVRQVAGLPLSGRRGRQERADWTDAVRRMADIELAPVVTRPLAPGRQPITRLPEIDDGEA